MSDHTKRAIQQAQEKLEQERGERLQQEIYSFLKEQLELVEHHKSRKAFHEGQIRIYEENIKNIKAGNVDAIEKRRESLKGTWQPFTYTFTFGNPVKFYNTFVAGTTISLDSGKTIIF